MEIRIYLIAEDDAKCSPSLSGRMFEGNNNKLRTAKEAGTNDEVRNLRSPG